MNLVISGNVRTSVCMRRLLQARRIDIEPVSVDRVSRVNIANVITVYFHPSKKKFFNLKYYTQSMPSLDILFFPTVF